MATKKPAPKKPIDAKALRKSAGLNQAQFWDRLGVCQSNGSRYENGHSRMPKPVQALLLMAYTTKAQALAMFEQLRGAH